GTYTYQSGSLKVADGDAPAYWASKANDQVIKAWYTSSDNETVNLSDQTKDLAYVVTIPQTTANFNESVSLKFSHALAKVRVELTGDMASFVDNVSIQSYTTCSFSQGTLSSDANKGEIKMYKVGDKMFEANVYPGCKIEQVMANNNGTWKTLSASVTPEAAKIHKITIAVENKNIETITLSSKGDEYTVESDKSIIINGEGSSLSKRIIIKENAKVMLKNVILAAPANGKNTIEIQGTATLLLSGINNITASDKSPLAVTSGTLTIDGTDADELTLNGGNGYNAGGLALSNGANLIINGGNIVADGSKTINGSGIGSYWTGLYNPYCGSITINGGKIKALGGGNSAGIGAGNNCKCGNIVITGGDITTQGGGNYGRAGIGSSSAGNCGNITISGNKTVVTATKGSASSNDIGIGDGGNCGTVTIKAGATVNSITYTVDHDGRI
ncbi:MAG: hypothetical protein Q4F77_12920, partial [Acinetobacter sp.]|uniref:fimbrillin family protein n=1 Tax=Acinetobacter sp. TaxID=472 RepID=UPI0026DEEC70